MIEQHSHNKCKITIVNKLDEIRGVANTIDQLALNWEFEPKFANQINLVVEEVISNIMFYAYPDSENHEINIELQNRENDLSIKIIDDGVIFNLLETDHDVDTQSPVEDRKVGGLGIHILKSLVDTIDYERINRFNVLTITKMY